MEGFFSKSQAMQTKAPTLGIAQCGACGLSTGCSSPKMPVSGRGARRVMLIGEAPGKNEDLEGRQFVGKSGQLLDGVLSRLGVDMRRDCWITNSVICRPEDNKLDPKSVVYCRPNVMRAIATHKPDVVVLLGGHAVDSLIGSVWKEDTGGITRWAGFQIPNHKPSCWICPTFHPSFLGREQDPVLDMMFHRHLKAAFALSGKPWPDGPPDYPSQVEVILNADAAAARVRKYRAGVIAFDFETDRLKPDHADADLVSCSVCWEGVETIAFPWHGSVRAAMVELLGDPDVGKIASNLKMEERWCRRKLGTPARNWVWDTMLSAHALDPRGGITGLKFQAYVKLGCPDYAYHIQPFLEAKEKGGNSVNRIYEIDMPTLLKYNGLDSLLEYHVAMHQRREMGVA